MNLTLIKKRYYLIAALTLIIIVMAMNGFSGIIKEPAPGSNIGNKENPDKQYVCSMHPQVIRDGPGDCPICGMFLIELVAVDKNSFDSSLTDIVRNVNSTIHAGVRTVIPEFSSLPVTIEATGVVNYDPEKVKTISAGFGGKVEKSFVKYQFQFIRKGQKILEVYNPYIYNERWNYVKLIQTYPERDDLTKEALEWFKLIGLSEGQIDSLKKTTVPDYYLPVYCRYEGYAVNRNFNPEAYYNSGSDTEVNAGGFISGSSYIGVNEGVTIETGDPLFKLIEPGSLRIDLKVKTEYAALLEKGQKVIIRDAANPGIQCTASIRLVDPVNGGLFQTVRAYPAKNEHPLFPGRQVEAKIFAGSHEALWVPASAVINLGKRCSAFVLADDKFIAVEVITGLHVGERVEILSGLDESSEIAEKALLLFDSDGLISL